MESRRDLAIRVDRAWGDEATAASVLREVGEWSFVDHFEHEGRRYFIAKRAPLGQACSPRERKVLEQAARGITNKEIAYQLALGTSTVSTHLSNAMRRLGLR